MLTKAYVEEIVNDYQVRVRIPIFDKLASSPGGTPTEQLSISPICAIPGGKYNYSVGDIVFVTFEDNDLGRPVILGQLYADIDNKGLMSLALDGLDVLQQANLPENTHIGKVTPDSIKNLYGIRSPIQQQIDAITGTVGIASSSNPYMSTILQNFMEAHYVLLPNGDYIVDSFKMYDTTSSYTPQYGDSIHYFYDFANNLLTELEETPKYELDTIGFSIDLSQNNVWDIQNSDVPANTPIYVVFEHSLEYAYLYAQINSTTQDFDTEGQYLFTKLTDTQVEINRVNLQPSQVSSDSVHGDKYFWDLLLSNFVSKFVVLPIGNLPEYPQKDVTYFTQGREGQGSYAGIDDFMFPWVFYPSDAIIVFSPTSKLSSEDHVRVYYEYGGQIEQDDREVFYGQYGSGQSIKSYKYTSASGIPDGSIIRISLLDTSGEQNIPTKSILYSMSLTDNGGWSVPIQYEIDDDADAGIVSQILLKDLVTNMVKQTFKSLSENYTISNVLQMVGVLSMQLCGINVRQLYGDLYSPRSGIDLEMYDSTRYSNQHGTTLQAVDFLFEDMYGDNVVYPNGVRVCKDILSLREGETLQAFSGQQYRWEPAYNSQGIEIGETLVKNQ